MKKYLYAIVLGMAIVIAIIIAYRLMSNTPKYRFGTDRAAVITQVQTLNRLETASFSIDKIIEAGTDYSALRQFLFGDKVLLIAHGSVVAGFDLSKMNAADFKGTGSSITLNLPAPEIFSTTIDNSQTRVFDRSQGLLTKGELNLESEARQQAEAAIRTAACEGGILNQASENAKKQLTTIFKSGGFTDVTITTQPGKCS